MYLYDKRMFKNTKFNFDQSDIDCFTHNQEHYFASSKINESTDIRKQGSSRKINDSIFAYPWGSNNSSSRSTFRRDYSSHHGRHVNGSEWTATRKYTGAANVCRWITIFMSNERRTTSVRWCTIERDGRRNKAGADAPSFKDKPRAV